MSDTKTFRVQVVSVNDNAIIEGKKGKYSGLEFKYVQNGEQKTKAIHSAFFDKKKAMIDELKSCLEGDTVEITVEGAPFFGLAGVKRLDATAAVATPTPSVSTSKPPFKSGFVDNSVGMQVGNALTNAATLIASGHITSKLHGEELLVSVAEQVLVAGELLKVRLIAGNYAPDRTPTKPPTTKKAPVKKPVVEEVEEEEDLDDPFGA